MPIKNEIQKGESRIMEFKEIFPGSNKIAKTMVAFSNGLGGKIIIGVKDRSKEIIGISQEDVLELPDRIANIIHGTCYPMIIPEIYIENVEGKDLLVIKVFPGKLKPYFLKRKGKLKGTYIRVGATNKLADSETIRELERQRVNRCFDEEIVYDYKLEELNLDKLIEDFLKYTKKELTKENLLNLKLVEKENGKYYPTKGLMLLTDTNYFEYARIKCAKFRGLDLGEIIIQREYSGPLYEQVEKSIQFLKENLTVRDGMPLDAIKEAIINAVVHRDYNISGCDIKIAIFDDRLEIASPGYLPKTLNIDDIKSGRVETRNKVIARFFKEIGYIKQWGTGIRKIITECQAKGLKEPIFKEAGMFFYVFFFKKVY